MEGTQTSLENRMLADTLGAFGEGSAAIVSPERGTLMLEGWLNALRGDVGTERIQAELTALRDQLKMDTPDPESIRHLLLSLASHTSAIAQEPSATGATSGQLVQLASALRNFSSQF